MNNQKTFFAQTGLIGVEIFSQDSKPFWYILAILDFDNSIDFIFSNPPYVSFTDNLDDSVSNFEPHHALYSYDHGLDDIYKIILQSKEKLSNSGLLFIENGKGQSECICKELRSNDFTDIAVHLDYNGTERFTSSWANTLWIKKL